MAERKFRFVVEFGLHCFTRGLNKHIKEIWNATNEALAYSDSREKRIFCFNRYDLSLKLPDHIKNMPSFPCYHTGKGNFFTVRTETSSGQEVELEIYFNVSRETKRKLRLYIASAYVRDDTYKSQRPPENKIGFFTIAYRTKIKKR